MFMPTSSYKVRNFCVSERVVIVTKNGWTKLNSQLSCRKVWQIQKCAHHLKKVCPVILKTFSECIFILKAFNDFQFQFWTNKIVQLK